MPIMLAAWGWLAKGGELMQMMLAVEGWVVDECGS